MLCRMWVNNNTAQINAVTHFRTKGKIITFCWARRLSRVLSSPYHQENEKPRELPRPSLGYWLKGMPEPSVWETAQLIHKLFNSIPLGWRKSITWNTGSGSCWGHPLAVIWCTCKKKTCTCWCTQHSHMARAESRSLPPWAAHILFTGRGSFSLVWMHLCWPTPLNSITWWWEEEESQPMAGERSTRIETHLPIPCSWGCSWGMGCCKVWVADPKPESSSKNFIWGSLVSRSGRCQPSLHPQPGCLGLCSLQVHMHMPCFLFQLRKKGPLLWC